jgi:ELWxxDGT repeat protein
VGNEVVFVAADPARGTELWITDGTPAGTRPLVDLAPGVESSWPRDLVALSPQGPVAFTAHRAGTGRELWWTDGTAPATRMLDEMVAGPEDVDPIRLLAFGRHVMFEGVDDAGAEPWILDVPWAAEIGNCRNGDDDDLDGLTDCADADCATQPACDADGDGAIDAEDCAPADPGARSVPAEVAGVTVTKDPGGIAVVSWMDAAADAGPATRFEVALDALDALRLVRSANAPCVARSLPAPPWTSGPAGSWYALVRAANACGPAPATGWGADSEGAERPACP